MTKQSETAAGLLTSAVTKATINLAYAQSLYQPPISNEFADRLIKAIKSTVKDNLERVMAEWEEATETNLNNAWLEELMTTQVVELAQIAIKSI